MAKRKEDAQNVTYKLEEVFTSCAPPGLAFVRRADHALFQSYMRERSRPICIEGPFQAGKTSLAITTARTVFPNGPIHVVCTSDSTLDSIIQTAFQLLQPYFHTEIVREGPSLPLGLRSAFGQMLKDEEGRDTITHASPPKVQFTSSVLAMFAADAERPLIIDDAQKLAPNEKRRLAHMVREWQTQVTQFGFPKIIVIASLERETIVASLLHDAPDLAYRLVYRPLLRMSADELRQIVQTGGVLLNVDFSEVQDRILALSGCLFGDQLGRPGYVHDLCRHACVVAGIEETLTTKKVISVPNFEQALGNWIDNCAVGIGISISQFLRNPPALVPEGGFSEELCKYLTKGTFGGIPLAELSKKLASDFGKSEEVCSAAITELVEREDGILALEPITQNVTFVEPLYLAYYDRTRNLSRDEQSRTLQIVASQDLARHLTAIMSKSSRFRKPN